MKRTLSIVLAAMLTVCCVSCSQHNAEEPENTPHTQVNEAAEEAESEVSYIETLGEHDFEGAEFVILASDTGGIFSIIPEEMNGSPINDAIITRDRAIEDRYNIKVVYAEYADDPSTAQTIISSVIAGDELCDVYNDALSNGSAYMGATYQSGSLYNMFDIPNLMLD